MSNAKYSRRLVEISSTSGIHRISIMSYNVLAAVHLNTHKYLYQLSLPASLKEDVRMVCILKHIDNCSPDILCLQEVQNYDCFQQHLNPLGYTGIYKKRTSHSTPQHEGCAIFYKNHLFTLHTYEDVEYNVNGLLEKDNVGQIVTLQINAQTSSLSSSRTKHTQDASTPYLCVTNTHLYFNPKQGYIKAGQIHVLLSKLYDHLSRIHLRIPVVMCGDWNMTPFSKLYSFITKGKLNLSNGHPIQLSGQIDPRPLFVRSRQYASISYLSNTTCYKTMSQHCDTFLPESSSRHSSVPIPHTLLHPFKFTSLYSLVSPKPYLCKDSQTQLITTFHNQVRSMVDFIFFGYVDTTLAATLPLSWQWQLGDSRWLKQLLPISDSAPPTDTSSPHTTTCKRHLEEGELDSSSDTSADNTEQQATSHSSHTMDYTIRAYSYLDLPHEQNLNALPNDDEGSDHLSIMGEFSLHPIRHTVTSTAVKTPRKNNIN